ncbi:MAG: hotdog fold thioesterase [Gammaproteobacteria bacterium]|nr:hotdog fold thioesterase [Gammaproteobacteria bacterium]MCW5584435.1 hotdog fold thioesterase [Gammaproteobacteria bacterium]
MKIWQLEVDLNIVTERGRGTMSEHLGIEFIEVGEDYLAARMPINQRTKQPMGIMHGGASCVLAETVGSTAAQFCVDHRKYYCVGLDINTNHLRVVREGYVIGTAKPFHLGKTTQVWGIEIKNEDGKLVSISRLTMAVLEKNN